MKRREVITLLGGAAASSACWPFAGRAQQQAAGRLPLVAVLVGASQAASYWVSGFPEGMPPVISIFAGCAYRDPSIVGDSAAD